MSRPCHGGLRDRTLNGSYMSLGTGGLAGSCQIDVNTALGYLALRAIELIVPRHGPTTSIKCSLSACCFIGVEIASYRNRDFCLEKKNRYRIVKKNTES
jgi:hypothetical protein